MHVRTRDRGASPTAENVVRAKCGTNVAPTAGVSRGWLCAICALAACDSGWHEGDPIDRASTTWRLIPATDGQRAVVTLEPRKIHRNENGVLTTGYSTMIVGPTIAVGLDDDATVATFEAGATHGVIGATRAWILQSSLRQWNHTAPGSGTPDAPLVRSTVFDRTTLVAEPTITLSPPIETPIAVGDALLDVSPSGASDAERDLFVRLREPDGTATVLHTGRGFASATCARGDGLVFAYQISADTLKLVSVRDTGTWQVTEATFPSARFDPLAIACDATLAHVALVLTSGVSVFDIAGGVVTLAVPGTHGPLALRGDGLAVVATRASDRALVFADSGGAVATRFITHERPLSPPVVVDDLAMFHLTDSLQTIDLLTGAAGPVVPRLDPDPEDYYGPFELRPWRAGNAIVVQQSRYIDTDYADHLGRISIVARDGVASLPITGDFSDPLPSLADGPRLYVKAYAPEADDPTVLVYDLPTRTLAYETMLPLCDEAAVLEERGCR